MSLAQHYAQVRAMCGRKRTGIENPVIRGRRRQRNPRGRYSGTHGLVGRFLDGPCLKNPFRRRIMVPFMRRKKTGSHPQELGPRFFNIYPDIFRCQGKGCHVSGMTH